MRSALTLDLDDRLREAVKRAASVDGVSEEELVEEALRRYIGLRGVALLDEIGEQQAAALSDDEAMAVAVAEIRAARAERREARNA